jgi:hypothetical protein
VLLPACLQAAWAGGGGRAEWHVRTFMLLKVRQGLGRQRPRRESGLF